MPQCCRAGSRGCGPHRRRTGIDPLGSRVETRLGNVAQQPGFCIARTGCGVRSRGRGARAPFGARASRRGDFLLDVAVRVGATALIGSTVVAGGLAGFSPQATLGGLTAAVVLGFSAATRRPYRQAWFGIALVLVAAGTFPLPRPALPQ